MTLLQDRETEKRLPDGWAEMPITAVADLNPPRPAKNALPADAPVSFVPMPAVDAELGAITNATNRAFADVRSGHPAFQDGDVIFAKITPCMENGKAAIARGLTNGLGFGSTEFHVFRPRLVTAEYLYHFLRQQSFRQAAEAEMTGSVGQRRVPAAFFDSVTIPLPPLDEQRRIAERIEAVLARASAAKERLARAQATMRRFRQAVLSAACSGRLTADWRGDGGAVGEDGLPAGWRLAAFADVTTSHDGKRIPVKSDDRANMKGEYPYYGASGIIDHVNRYLFDGDYLLVAEDGANLLSRSTPIAFEASGRFWVNNHAHVVQPKPGCISRYLSIFLNGLDLQEWVTGSAQPKLTQAALSKIPVPLPPLAEQVEITRMYDDLSNLRTAANDRVRVVGDRTERLVQATLAKAFRGELLEPPRV